MKRLFASCISECKESFGENCQYPCNGYCINKTCDRFNGSCLYGCENGQQCDRGIHLKCTCCIEPIEYVNDKKYVIWKMILC